MGWISSAKRDRDRGALSVEWIGVIAIVVVLVGAIVAASSQLSSPVGTTVAGWVECLRPGGSCGGESPDVDDPIDPNEPNAPSPGEREVAFEPGDLPSFSNLPDPPGEGPDDDRVGGPQFPEIDMPDGPRGDVEVGDPVNTLSGAFTVVSTDVTQPPSGSVGIPFSFARTYDSTRTTAGTMGTGWWHTYEVRLSRVDADDDVVFTNETGEQITFEADGDELISPAGVYSQIEETADGYTLTRKDGDRLKFDEHGRLVVQADRFDYETQLRYEGDELREVEDASGRLYTFEYDEGLLTSVRSDDGREAEFAYEDERLTQVTALDGQTTTMEYDEDGRLVEAVDAEGRRTVTNTYDDQGRVVEQVDPAGEVWQFQYEDDGLTVVTDPVGNQWSHVYRKNLLVAQADPRGNTSTYQYDENNELVAITNPREHTFTMERDGYGNVVALDGPQNTQFNWRMRYDDDHNLVEVTDPSNNSTSISYNETGALRGIIDPEGNEILLGYDDDLPGLPTSITDPLGNTTGFTYDDYGQPTEVEDADGALITMEYDQAGNLIETVDPLGNAEGADPSDHRNVMNYDDMGRLVELVDVLGNQTTYGYDAVGNLISVADGTGDAVTFMYDERDMVVSVEDPYGQLASYTYDAAGNLVVAEDQAGVEQSLEYDEAGRATSLTDGAGNTYQYRYDANGNITEVVAPTPDETGASDEGGISSVLTYDELDQMTRAEYEDDTPTLDVDYTPTGQIREITNGASTERFSYTPTGMVDVHDANGHMYAHEYDAAGNLIAQVLPDGSELALEYDEAHRPVRLEGPDQTVDIDYDIAGRIVEAVEDGDAPLAHSFGYDAAGQILEMTSTGPEGTLTDTEYAYNELGLPVTVNTVGEMISYDYDGRGSLLEEERSDAESGDVVSTFAYTYDQAGRRVTEEHDGARTTYLYDDAGRVSSIDGSDGVIELEYDEHSHVAQMGDREFTYDQRGLVTSAQTEDAAASYEHDVFGRVTSTVISEGTPTGESDQARRTDVTAVQFASVASMTDTGVPEPDQAGGQTSVWPAGESSQPTFFTDEATDETSRLLGGVGASTETTGSDPMRLLPDHAGNAGSVVGPDGGIDAEFSYSPFGQTLEAEGGDADNVLSRYAGQIPDQTAGTYQFGERSYDPDFGVFLQASGGPGGGPDQVPNSPQALSSETPGTSGQNDQQAGTAALPIIAVIGIGALIGGVIGGIGSLIEMFTVGDGFDVKKLLVDVLVGALMGALTGGVGAIKGILAKVGLGFVTGALGNLIKQIFDGAVDWLEVLLSGILGAVFSGIAHKINDWLKKAWNEFFKKLVDEAIEFLIPTVFDIVWDLVTGVVDGIIIDGIRRFGCWIAGLWGGCDDDDSLIPEIPGISVPQIPTPGVK